MNKFLLFLSFLTLATSPVLAKDHASLWSSIHEELHAFYFAGFLQGMMVAKANTELQNEPGFPWNASQRIVMQVHKNTSKVDAAAVTRVMSDLYKDPANAQIPNALLFFPAAARLLGVSESEISEALRIMRQSTP